MLLALALAGAAVAVPASGQDAGTRASQARDARQLGRAPVNQVRASCPANCEAVGRVTGYQLLSGGRRNVYRVPANGRIIAWTLKMSRPNRSQTAFFNDFYGGTPQARLAVLQPGRGSVLSLVRQSPVESLESYLGEHPTFILDQGLRVRRGNLLGLTTTTWVPAFATRLSGADAWRASRPSNRCSNVRRSSAHTATGTRRSYGCVYRTARLLYTAWFVPDRR